MSQARKLHPYLVCTAREQAHLHKTCPVVDAQGAYKAKSLFGIRGGSPYRSYSLKAVHGFLAQKMSYEAGLLVGPASGYPRHIFLVHRIGAQRPLRFIKGGV